MKAAFHTLGCKTNSYETQAIIEQFEKAGFEIVPFTEAADVYIINTCSVTAVAAQKSRQMLHRCRKFSPSALVVACGCYAQEAAEKLTEDGSVDLVIGNNEKSKVLDLVLNSTEQTRGEERICEEIPTDCRLSGDVSENDTSSCNLVIKEHNADRILIDDLTRCRDYESQRITNAGSHVRAYVKIQDGCDRFCSYCIIPFLRGRSRSRNMEEILQEVQDLADAGMKEIVLTGIDISDFCCVNSDNTAPKIKGNALAELILSIEKIKTIERIRLGSLEAGIITKDFLDQIRESKKLCPHFHLSLQSGSDTTLKRMNRDYSTSDFLESLSKIRSVFQEPAITTDVIVGFPQETETEFEETIQFVQKAGFSQLHVFPYSRRKGTRADKMQGQLSKAQKAERARFLIKEGEKLQRSYMERFFGKPVQVLIEEVVYEEGREWLVGFTPEYVRSAVRVSEENYPETIINKIVTIYPKKIQIIENELFLTNDV
ncbi:MAG: tRNA (N(6)-L-threonylcarbamoyladenosine(37)-C(2))-methylthiotransferase MtaB [Parasporobacterium sp.]|nr:tRNA (N(6)-L-threonylcarbamoyladenosine(37)-C(2))-methylthiotransferase MtaB [Parasporobacterium sp.]